MMPGHTLSASRAGAVAPLPEGEQQVLRSLRQQIHNCELMPGERLKFEDLRGRYNVSVGKLREVLTALQAEGLVRSERNRGFIVSPATLSDLMDITELRVELERRALRQSLEHGDERWEAQLVSAWHLLSRVQEQRVAASELDVIWAQRHEDFHQALVAACPSEWTLRFRAQLFGLSHRYRCLATRARAATGHRGFGEHEELLKLALARDADGVGELMERHIRASTESVLSVVPEFRKPQ